MTVENFVKWVYPATKETDIDRIFTTSQAALESGWGKSAIGNGNNLFGITKGSSWNGAVILVNTTEYFSRPNISFKAPEKVLSVSPLANGKYKYRVKRLFRDYDSLAECLKDHSSILQKPIYADAWPYRHDRNLFVEKIVDNVGGKYATDPDYVSKMKKIFRIVEKEVERQGLD
jgi:flagellar protein FlgJ